jgi:hypothetical protein
VIGGIFNVGLMSPLEWIDTRSSIRAADKQ